MSFKTWITVPTYWGHPTGVSGPESFIYDHPTPLDILGTIPRMLDSFLKLEGDFSLFFIAGSVHKSIEQDVHRKVLSVLEPYSKRFKDILLLSDVNIGGINRLLPEPLLSLSSYGNIRNAQIAVPYLLGCENIIGIDDDEIILDTQYVNKALEYIGKVYNGDFVGGMAGPYFDSNGEFRIMGAESLENCTNMYEKKNYFMNEALKKVLSTPGLKISNVSFGGNMVISREVIETTCFDPYIPRGEDYDYVISAKTAGFNFYTRPDMPIVHLPPDSTGSQAGDSIRKLAADVKRFIYVKEKHTYHWENYPNERFDIAYVMPYPGVYLEKSIDELLEDGRRCLVDVYPGNFDEKSAAEFVDNAYEAAKVKAREFFVYRELWRKSLTSMQSNKKMQDLLIRSLKI